MRDILEHMQCYSGATPTHKTPRQVWCSTCRGLTAPADGGRVFLVAHPITDRQCCPGYLESYRRKVSALDVIPTRVSR